MVIQHPDVTFNILLKPSKERVTDGATEQANQAAALPGHRVYFPLYLYNGNCLHSSGHILTIN
jgi:hypothetical protein